MLTDILRSSGATRRPAGGGARSPVTGGGRGIRGVDLDLSAAGELTPTLVALAAFADGPSTFTGIGHIRAPRDRPPRRARRRAQRPRRRGVTELRRRLRIEPAPLHGGLWRALRTTTAWRRPARSSASPSPGVEIDDIGTDREDAAAVHRSSGSRCWRRRLRDALRRRPRHVSWLDDDDDDEPEFDEADVRVRPNPKANRPRTKRRPAHADAVIGTRARRRPRPLHGPRRRGRRRRATRSPRRARASCGASRSSRATASTVVGDTTGDGGTLARIVGIERAHDAAAPQRRRHRRGRAHHRRQRRPDAHRRRRGGPRAAHPPRRPLPRRGARRRHPAPARRHQDRPRRPVRVPRELRGPRPRGLHERAATRCRSSEIGAALVGHSHGVRRALRRRQVDARERARARAPTARPATSTRSPVAAATRRRRPSRCASRTSGGTRLGHRHPRRALLRPRPRRPGEHPARVHRPRRDRRGLPARLHPPARRAGLRDRSRPSRRARSATTGRCATRLAAAAAARPSPTTRSPSAASMRTGHSAPCLRWTDDRRTPRPRRPRPRLHPPRPGRQPVSLSRPPRPPRHPVLLPRGDDARLHDRGLRLPRQPRTASGAPATRRSASRRTTPEKLRRFRERDGLTYDPAHRRGPRRAAGVRRRGARR